MTSPSPLRIAQVTDTHLFADVDQELLGCPTNVSFETVLAQLNQLQPSPDILLLTGDLSHDESTESYQRLQELLRPLEIPTYWLPGNHDDLPVMQQILKQPPIFAENSFQVGGWHCLLLSSWIPGCVHGQLDSDSLRWLELKLQLVNDKPTLIALHHPPCLVDSKWLDAINLHNAEELLAVLDRYPQVKLVVFGHIHQEFDHHRREVSYLGSPSTCVQFKPASREFSLDQAQPGFRLLTLFPDGTYQTKVERVSL